jgi:hypothetical protein
LGREERTNEPLVGFGAKPGSATGSSDCPDPD